MDKINEIADRADMIVCGYAFTRENGQIRILNLNNTEKALVISGDGKMPKYYQDKIYGYYLYFTSFCVVECMHVHGERLEADGRRLCKVFRESQR